jgi:inhibitor of KinA
MNLLPLGDQAVLAYCDDERAALVFAGAVRQANPSWLIDVVQAYTSVAIFFDLDQTDLAEVEATARRVEQETKSGDPASFLPEERPLHRIPCCYEMQQDLERVASWTGLPADTVIRLHQETKYTIYAIGFCPGFPYLGYLPAPLCGVPRLDKPRLRVEAGSVGLTERQTGIYTEVRPGGWNIIGRTPLELVNVVDGYFPLRTGDRVQLERIDEGEFQRLVGERLPVGKGSAQLG